MAYVRKSKGSGKKKRVGRPRKMKRGKGIMDILRKGHALAKKHKAVSRLATHFGFHNVAKAAKAIGYGRRRRGGGFFGNLWSGIKRGATGLYNHALRPAWNAGLISKGLAMIPHPAARAAATAVRAVGGRRVKRGGARRGGSSLSGRLFLI